MAKNSLLPSVDLTSSYQLNDLDNNINKSINSIEKDSNTWEVGFKVTLQWGRDDQANYKKRDILTGNVKFIQK